MTMVHDSYCHTTIAYFLIFISYSLVAQPFSKQYIMAFHTCELGICMGPATHQVRLAESNDLSNWTLVPNFLPYQGSVPDVIVRNNQLYIYTPNKVKRYNNTTNLWDNNPPTVSITDSLGNAIQYVDPSPMLDTSGRIVLFFLNSTGLMGQDPAACTSYPCYKYFDSAVEVLGSNGTQFVLQSGHRAVISLDNMGSPPTASDPDIYYDNEQYILYISQGQNTLAYHSPTLHGSYVPFTTLPNNGTLTTQGGIACGIFETGNQSYHTFVHSNINGTTVIRHATHNQFSTQVLFNTVVSGNLLGLGNNIQTESPGICRNTWLPCYFQPNISGNLTVCTSNTTLYTYSVPQLINHTYTWTATNGSIISGQNTAQISVLWQNEQIGNLNLIQTAW